MSSDIRARRRTRKRGGGGGGMSVARFVIFFLVLPLFVGLLLGGFLAFSRTVPSIVELKQEVIPPGTKVFADDDTLIGEIKILQGKFVPLKEMPQDLISAVVAIEDSNFWRHKGIDYTAIMRAAVKDILAGHLKQGGSTITQQLAKNTLLSSERTFKRKLKEVVLATRIERNMTKEEILEIYLNRAYFGHGAYGVEMAARTYFGKAVRELTIPECAIIAGLLKAPNAYSPRNDFTRAKERQEQVLKRMEDEGYINRSQRLKAMKTSLTIADTDNRGEATNYFIDFVKDYLLAKYGEDAVYRNGMSAYTTLNKQAQFMAQAALQRGLRDVDKRRGFRGPIGHVDIKGLDPSGGGLKASYRAMPLKPGDITKGVVVEVSEQRAVIKAESLSGTLMIEDAQWASKHLNEQTLDIEEIPGFSLKSALKPGDLIWVQVKSLRDGKAIFTLEQEPQVQGAVAAVEARTGYIRALVGGYSFAGSPFNRAIYSKRQPGSAFKPVVYALAVKTRQYTPATLIVDEAVTFEKEVGSDEQWTPQNYDENYLGPIRLRKALALSRNVVTVKLVDTIGVNKVIEFSRSLGVTGDMPRDLSLSLGSLSMTPLELTSAYGAFANAGLKMRPLGIKYVTDRKGRIIESNEPQGERVMDSESAFLITSMLESVVTEGTGWRAKALKRPVAAKTGTSNDYRDAWFVGYTADMVAGVWVGFDEPKPLGHEETGSRAASPIWVDFMLRASEGTASRPFDRPDTIVTRNIDPESGKLASKWTKKPMVEYFIKGTEPTEEAPGALWGAGGGASGSGALQGGKPGTGSPLLPPSNQLLPPSTPLRR